MDLSNGRLKVLFRLMVGEEGQTGTEKGNVDIFAPELVYFPPRVWLSPRAAVLSTGAGALRAKLQINNVHPPLKTVVFCVSAILKHWMITLTVKNHLKLLAFLLA